MVSFKDDQFFVLRWYLLNNQGFTDQTFKVFKTLKVFALND